MRFPVAGNTPETEPENRAFYPALDGMRAFAFLLVFAQHYLKMPWGFAGVDLFFVLSGFLITGILLDTRDTAHRIRNFYVRRTLRIFPLYFGVFLILLLLTPLVHWNWNRAWMAWPLYVGNYLCLKGPVIDGTAWQWVVDAQLGNPQPLIYLGHLWSLCVEEQFYLVWPWVVFFVRSRRALILICVSSVVLAPLARLYLHLHSADYLFNTEVVLSRVTPLRIDALLLGGLVALLFRSSLREGMLRVAKWLFTLATVVIVPCVVYAIHAMPSYIMPSWHFTWGLTLIDCYAATMLLTALQPGTWLYRLFKLAPLRWLGRVSYGAYVFHDIYHPSVFDGVRAVFAPMPPNLYVAVGASIAFVFTVVAAGLSYRYFETPFLNLKERWTVRTTTGDLIQVKEASLSEASSQL